MNVLQENLMT